MEELIDISKKETSAEVGKLLESQAYRQYLKQKNITGSFYNR
jgi:hypothetical protein